MNSHPEVGTIGLSEPDAEERYGKENIKVCVIHLRQQAILTIQ